MNNLWQSSSVGQGSACGGIHPAFRLDKLKRNLQYSANTEPDSLARQSASTVAALKDCRYERASVLQSRDRNGVGFGVEGGGTL
jgi:hypothetical protein